MVQALVPALLLTWQEPRGHCRFLSEVSRASVSPVTDLAGASWSLSLPLRGVRGVRSLC